MSGLRFESVSQMPEGMRRLISKKQEQIPKNKYGAIRTEECGIKFASKKEARRFAELSDLLKCGEIERLKLQPQFTLQESYITETGERIRAIRYTADFSYIKKGMIVVEDVKSRATRTKEYLRNRKMMREKFGIDIKEV